MHRNPWLTMILGLMVGLVIGYVLAEQQPVPPGRALRLGMVPPTGQSGDELPEGHPPVDGSSPAEAQRLRQQVAEIEGLLASAPDDPGLMAALGNVYFDANRWQEAREWYEKSLQLSSGDANVFTDLAVVYRNLGQPQRAIELLDQAIAISPDHWQAWYNKAVVYNFDLHEHDAAIEAFRILQELKKDNPRIPDLSGLEREVLGS
jgi:tetratricopeptide (TPR) repeat protein